MTKKMIEFNFGEKKIKLNKQQSEVVYEDLNKNILIIACAGSGKTTTILCRIKYLIDNGVSPSSIILTTFTRDATNDMKTKLNLMFGYTPDIEVGTIDSISLRNLRRYGNIDMKSNISVSEYSIKFLRFLRTHENKSQYLEQKKYLFVDEFQDINDIQSDIITEYYNSGVKVIAVGDDAQNIYSFRGSNITHILTFDEKYENVAKHKLIKNYRSTPEIINLANESIEFNKYQIPKKMVPHHKSIGEKPNVEHYYSWDMQNLFIKDKIADYITKGIPKHEIAVLCRTNRPLIPIEEILTKNGINNIFLDNDKVDIKKKVKEEHICLCTIHKAKGLEWKVVFIIALNDYWFPSGKNIVELEEERRLFYVAVTRAKEYLHMSFTPYAGTSYVSRFITELDKKYYNFIKFKKKYEGYAEGYESREDLSVTKLIENLDGSDYTMLREMGILAIEFSKQEIYERYGYLNFVKENDIHPDFGIFIDCLVTRMFGEVSKNSNGLYYEPALLAIANVKLNVSEYSVYKRYRQSFVYNLENVSRDDSLEIMINKLEHSDKYTCTILDCDRSIVMKIIQKMFRKSDKFNVPFHKIPIYSERFLPSDFEKKMETELIKFTNEQNNSNDIYSTVWEIAKCDKIVRDGRRRLLYKDIDMNELDHYRDMFNDIREQYVLPIASTKKVKCHFPIKLDNGVYGELDLLAGSSVIDIKTSNSPTVQTEWLLQVLCYAHMCRRNNIKINQVQIFNPLTGTVHYASIKDWNHGEVLIEFLLNVQEKRRQRTQLLIDQQNKSEEKINNFHKKKEPTNTVVYSGYAFQDD